jgi:hypothetical protein
MVNAGSVFSWPLQPHQNRRIVYLTRLAHVQNRDQNACHRHFEILVKQNVLPAWLLCSQLAISNAHAALGAHHIFSRAICTYQRQSCP